MPYPITVMEIAKTEARTGFRFPLTLKTRFASDNGGYIDMEGDCWQLIPFSDTSDPEGLARTGKDIVQETTRMRNCRGFPPDAFVVAQSNSGDCLFIRPEAEGSTQLGETVYLWDHETGNHKAVAPCFMSLRERLEQQLETAPEAEVIGVVGATGVTGLGGAWPADPWCALLTFSGWRERGGALQKSELTLRREVPEAESNRLQRTVAPFGVRRVRVRLAKENVFGSPQALMIGPLEKDDADAELLALARELQEPVTFRDRQFGLFTLDRRLNWYEATTRWGGKRVCLNLKPDESGATEQSLATARSLWGSQPAWQRRITDYAVEQLLGLKNEAWLGEDETQVTAAGFAGKLELDSIVVRADGSFEFWHNDGELFWGHSIRVIGNLTEGPNHAGIEG